MTLYWRLCSVLCHCRPWATWRAVSRQVQPRLWLRPPCRPWRAHSPAPPTSCRARWPPVVPFTPRAASSPQLLPQSPQRLLWSSRSFQNGYQIKKTAAWARMLIGGRHQLNGAAAVPRDSPLATVHHTAPQLCLRPHLGPLQPGGLDAGAQGMTMM